MSVVGSLSEVTSRQEKFESHYKEVKVHTRNKNREEYL